MAQPPSKDTKPRRGVDNGRCASEDALGFEGGWTPGGVPAGMLEPEGGGL